MKLLLNYDHITSVLLVLGSWFMKKLLGIVVLSLLLICNAHAASKWGKGELTLSDGVTNGFIKFIKGNSTKSPHLFAVSIDGRTMMYYYCASGPNNCRGGDSHIIEECERRSDGVECALFARTRTIKWKNDINPGKGKASTIKSKWSEAEIRAKLTELGFLGGSSSTPTTTTPKITKKTTGSTLDLTKELKELKELLDSEILTQDEFTKLKENLLKKYK